MHGPPRRNGGRSFLFPLLSSGQSVFDAVTWQTYLLECTRFIMADSDSTDGSRKIKAARTSGELNSLSRTAIEDDVAAFFIDFESVAPVARLHKLILHRTALLRMDANLPNDATPLTHRLNEAELRCNYSSFERMLSPTRSFVDSLVDLLR